jgi:microcystin-dependent protein
MWSTEASNNLFPTNTNILNPGIDPPGATALDVAYYVFGKNLQKLIRRGGLNPRGQGDATITDKTQFSEEQLTQSLINYVAYSMNYSCGGSANAITLSASTLTVPSQTYALPFIPPSVLQDGMQFKFRTTYANTDAVTIAITNLLNSPIPLLYALINSTSYAALQGGDLSAGQSLIITYNSTANAGSPAFIIDAPINHIGDYKQSALTTSHHGWLLCNGFLVSRITYARLFAKIGTSFGAGDGSTTFGLPDATGRVVGNIGQGTGLTNRTMGQSIGEENHTLTIAEMPAHTHNVGQSFFLQSGSNSTNVPGSGNTPSSSIGGGGAHNIMQPTLFAGNTFIYAGV